MENQIKDYLEKTEFEEKIESNLEYLKSKNQQDYFKIQIATLFSIKSEFERLRSLITQIRCSQKEAIQQRQDQEEVINNLKEAIEEKDAKIEEKNGFCKNLQKKMEQFVQTNYSTKDNADQSLKHKLKLAEEQIDKYHEIINKLKVYYRNDKQIKQKIKDQDIQYSRQLKILENSQKIKDHYNQELREKLKKESNENKEKQKAIIDITNDNKNLTYELQQMRKKYDDIYNDDSDKTEFKQNNIFSNKPLDQRKSSAEDIQKRPIQYDSDTDQFQQKKKIRKQNTKEDQVGSSCEYIQSQN